MLRKGRIVGALSPFALFSFLLNFVWEMLQSPFFAHIPDEPHWQMTLICLQATNGDVGITLLSVSTAAGITRAALWFLPMSRRGTAPYLVVGLGITALAEWHALSSGRWAYSRLMPVLPLRGIGLVPILRWTVLPVAVLALSRRLYQGSTVRTSVAEAVANHRAVQQ